MTNTQEQYDAALKLFSHMMENSPQIFFNAEYHQYIVYQGIHTTVTDPNCDYPLLYMIYCFLSEVTDSTLEEMGFSKNYILLARYMTQINVKLKQYPTILDLCINIHGAAKKYYTRKTNFYMAKVHMELIEKFKMLKR